VKTGLSSNFQLSLRAVFQQGECHAARDLHDAHWKISLTQLNKGNFDAKNLFTVKNDLKTPVEILPSCANCSSFSQTGFPTQSE
jgi:hypothetical protein